jgi:hypothetical protein
VAVLNLIAVEFQFNVLKIAQEHDQEFESGVHGELAEQYRR